VRSPLSGGHCRCDQLVEYVSGDLAVGALDAVRTHLGGCPDCHVRVERIEATLCLVVGAGNIELNALNSSRFTGLVRRRIAVLVRADSVGPIEQGRLGCLGCLFRAHGRRTPVRRCAPAIATIFPAGAAAGALQREGLDDVVRDYWLDMAITDKLLGELGGIDREASLVMVEEN